ncbi:MAG: glycosyltransferase family 4 protein [Candidatus Jordarchaeales archaeon]
MKEHSSEENPRLRILMISGTFYPEVNGTVIAVANLMKALGNRGHEVWLLTRIAKGASSKDFWQGMRVIRVGPKLGGLVGRFTLAVNQFYEGVKLMRVGFDIIHANGFNALIVGLMLGRLFKVPVVATFHGFQRLWAKEARWRTGLTFSLTYPVEKFLLKRADKVIFQSKTLFNAIKETYSLSDIHAEIIPHPLDVSRFRFSEGNLGKPTVLFVGSLIRVHGVDLLIEAVPHVIKKVPNVRIIVVGSGPRHKYIEDLIKRRGISHAVKLVGRVTNPSVLAQIYAESTVVVIPLRYRGYILSLVAEEAMASGRPVVTTMTLDPELANHGVYMVKSSPENIAKAVVSILRMEREKYHQLCVSARKYIEEFCTQEAVVLRVEKAYLALIENLGLRKKAA